MNSLVVMSLGFQHNQIDRIPFIFSSDNIIVFHSILLIPTVVWVVGTCIGGRMIQAIGIIWNCALNMNNSRRVLFTEKGGKRSMSRNGKPRGRGKWNFSKRNL